ncbi:MAG: S1 family peptidase [Methyloceanibacter sp.]
MTTIDQFSLTTAPIEQFFKSTSLGHATGFVWYLDGIFYLVTNWHVVTCRNFQTGDNLTNHGGRPDKLRVMFNIRTPTFGKQRYDLIIRDENGEPLWLVYPGRRLDVVAIPLPFTGTEPTFILNPINTLASADLAVGVGMDVFILGYPFGAEPPGLPVWKQGSIASEPELARLTTDYFLVDTASRPGMSGAPVIRRSWGYHLFRGDTVSMGPGAETTFIGVYSGRIHTADTSDAQLGLVWPASYINEIIVGNTRDTDA